MEELVFLKLGGSLLTDKARPQALRQDVLNRLAVEIASALSGRPGLRLVIGHGSGSYGHVAASRYGTRKGVASAEGWRGYAETARVAGQLDRLVVDALAVAGVPALPIQPSASARCHDGELQSLDDRPVRVALAQGLVPVLYGDVALDDVRGGTIVSTEEIFAWLAPRLAPRRIILAGEVAGVLQADAAYIQAGGDAPVISDITAADWPRLAETLGGARGFDVTGGMLGKVDAMLQLVQNSDTLACVQLISGLAPGLLAASLLNPIIQAGSTIHR